MRWASAKPNIWWRVGPVVLIDVSTKKNPRAIAMIDAADVDLVLSNSGKWGSRKQDDHNVYAWRHRGREHDAMHRLVLRLPRGALADHRNGDTLDNRRLNLRPATQDQNNRNARDRAGSGAFKGVSFHKATGKWQAQIQGDGKNRYLGLFADQVEAARAYDEAARRFHGEFARTNFREAA